MAGRRIQDWTNKNVFVNSFDWPPDVINAGPSNSLYQSTNLQTIGESAQEQKLEEPTVSNDPSKNANGEEELDEEGLPKKSITALQGVWNITNAIQGMFIVGLPFAVKVGGWFAVFALIAVAYICYRTGLALIECLYEEEDQISLSLEHSTIQPFAQSGKTSEASRRRKVRHSYREVADAVRPGLGHFVLVAQLTELISTCILYIVLAGDLLQGCVPSVDRSAWMMLITSILLSTAFLNDIRVVSDLSFANTISHLAINFIVLLYCCTQVRNWQLSSVAIIPDFRLFPTVMGVVVFGYTSHIFLPSLEASMTDPRKVRWMLSQSHLAAALFKAIFGLIGFLTFADFTQKEISNSLPNQAFKVLINSILVVKALLSYPLPYFATVQLLTHTFFRGTQHTWFSSCFGTDRRLRDWAVCLRIILILWTLLIALSVPYLIELMGLIGNITGTVLSFIWPAYFHLKLKGARLSDAERRFDKFVITLGVSLCVIGVYYSAAELRSVVAANAAETDIEL